MFDLENPSAAADLHSYARPLEWYVHHVHLELDVDFDRKILRGSARLHVDRGAGEVAAAIQLDSRDLNIQRAEYTTSERLEDWQETEFAVGDHDPILGSPLRVSLPSDTRMIRIFYETSPLAPALQWLEPAQTTGGRHPFLFSQSQAIHARSWIPLQDSPGIRASYSANIRVPKPLVAVMSTSMENPGQPHMPRRREVSSPSAQGSQESGKADAGSAIPLDPLDSLHEFRFLQPRKVPSYLIALAAGELGFANIDPDVRRELADGNDSPAEPRRRIRGRTGVYAEPAVIAAAADEFEDTEKMIRVVEKRFGRYRWGRYDLLILPPSFPFGGMENPCLTFVTPTVIAGDKSLVSLIAHELAHSWSGNLVTNATWRDFWLNEGFTVYLERRILEDLYGRDRADMEATLAYQELREELSELPDRDQILYVDLAGRDPDEGFTGVPYQKGALFLTAIEEAVGRDAFDVFLRAYFQHFGFRSITTQEFLDYLADYLVRSTPGLEDKVPVMEWVTQPGLPPDHPVPTSDLLARVDQHAEVFARSEAEASAIPFATWGSLQQLRFLRSLPKQIDAARLSQLDREFHVTSSRNAEVLSQWLLMALRNGYEPAYPRVERFLLEVGRRKFLKPMYEELVKTPEGLQRAQRIYARARPGYHPITVATVDSILASAGGQH